MARLTKRMAAVMEANGFAEIQPFKRYLAQTVVDRGLTNAASDLGVSKATLGYWLLKLGINVRRVAVVGTEEFRQQEEE